MTARLEIEIDEPLLQKAEEWAKQRGITLASAVAAYLHELTQEESPQPRSEWLKGLAGIGRSTASEAKTSISSTDYDDYLERKYS